KYEVEVALVEAERIQFVVLAASAQTELDDGRARVGVILRAQEHVLELDHARVGEQQGRVVGGNERRGRHDLVALAAEDLEEFAADARGGVLAGRGHDGPGGTAGRSGPSRDTPTRGPWPGQTTR